MSHSGNSICWTSILFHWMIESFSISKIYPAVHWDVVCLWLSEDNSSHDFFYIWVIKAFILWKLCAFMQLLQSTTQHNLIRNKSTKYIAEQSCLYWLYTSVAHLKCFFQWFSFLPPGLCLENFSLQPVKAVWPPCDKRRDFPIRERIRRIISLICIVNLPYIPNIAHWSWVVVLSTSNQKHE